MCNDIERSEITVMIPKAQPKVTYNDTEASAKVTYNDTEGAAEGNL